MDKSQLAPINERESKVFNNTTITLDKIHRQAENNPILPILAQLRVGHKTRFNEIDEYLYTYSRAEDFYKSFDSLFRSFDKRKRNNRRKILAYTNARVKAFNDIIRKVLYKERAEDPYNKFEFLTGYENFEYNNHKYYNSMDYVIISVQKCTKIYP